MSEFIRNLASIARKDKSLAWVFIDENILRYDPEEVLKELIEHKHELDRDIFCYILVRLSLVIDVFSPNALQIIQIAHNTCREYTGRIINALKFNLVSRLKSVVSFELWELLGPRISFFLHELANNKINIGVILNELPRETVDYLRRTAVNLASLVGKDEKIVLVALVLLWIFLNKLWDKRFKREWKNYFSTVIHQANDKTFFIAIIPVLYLLDIKTSLDTIVSEVLRRPRYFLSLYDALLLCGLLEINHIFPISAFISNVVYIFSLSDDETIRFMSILSSGNVSELKKFISSKMLRLLTKRLERISRSDVEQLLLEAFKLAEKYPNEFLEELMQFFKSAPMINDLMIDFFIKVAEKSTEEKIINAILREIMIKSKITDILKVVYRDREFLKRLIMKACFTTLLEIARILRQLYISLPVDAKRKVEAEYSLIREERIYSLDEDKLREVLVSFLDKI